MYFSVVVAVMLIGVPVYLVLAVVGVVPSVVKKIVAAGSEAVRLTACAVLKSPPPGLGVTATPEICPDSWNRSVWMLFTPGPPTSGPSTWKTLVPKGLPVTRWGTAKLPMNPAGGASTAVPKVSQVRKGPMRLPSARLTSQATPAALGTQPTSVVALMPRTPPFCATNVSTP